MSDGPAEDDQNTRILPTSVDHAQVLHVKDALISPQTPAEAPVTSRRGSLQQQRRKMGFNTRTVLLSLLALAPASMAETCISLSGSTQCPAFSSASISVDSTLIGFL